MRNSGPQVAFSFLFFDLALDSPAHGAKSPIFRVSPPSLGLNLPGNTLMDTPKGMPQEWLRCFLVFIFETYLVCFMGMNVVLTCIY